MRARDSAVRERAQTDFAAPLLVEAGAGSGKTSILVARIVAWTLGPGWDKAEAWLRERGEEAVPDRVAQRALSRVVAITFTDAAAAEMAQRVGEWLGEIASGADPQAVFVEALPSEEVRRARAEVLRSSLDRLVVRTIHAFCRRLLAESPMEAGLHPAFEVDADEEGMTRAVREVMEHALPRAYADPEAALSRLAAAGFDPQDVEEALLVFVQAGVPSSCLKEDPFSPERVGRFREKLRAACAAFVAAEEGRLVGLRGAKNQGALGSIGDTQSLLEDRLDDSEFVSGLQDIWKENFVDKIDEWASGDFGKTDAIGDRAEPTSAACRSLHPLLDNVLKVDPSTLETWRHALTPLLAEVEARLRTSGIETFAALLADARELVEGKPHVARKVREGIDQLLVDEFQDTDDVQCAIVEALGLQGEPEARPGLFLVGDPRQSIYGWRSADLRSYEAFVAKVEAAGGERLYLTRNFRSLPAVLAEVGRCMEGVMVERPGVQPPFQELLAEREGAGEIEHWLSWRWDAEGAAPGKTRAPEATEIEAQALAEDVTRLHGEGVAWRDVAVLFKAMTNVDAYLDALRDAGVPYTVERDRRYFQRREVIEASALLRTVLDPHDHVALVAWLRSASVGVPDAAWVPLWARGFPEKMSALQGQESEQIPARLEELRACIAEAAAAVAPETPGLGRIEGWEGLLWEGVEALAELRRRLHTEASDDFIEALRTRTLIEVTEAGRYLGPYRVANLDQFFRDVQSDLEETGGDVSEVLRRIRLAVENQAEVEEARPREAADDAVRIMSIHKAKGLDFDHVYLPQLHRGAGGRSPQTRVGRGPQRGEYQLFGVPTLGFGEAEEQRQQIEEAERVRTLYVAMTRARNRLVLIGKHAIKGDSLSGSHAALLAERRAGAETRMAELAGRGEAAERSENGVLWRFPSLAPARAALAVAAAAGDPLPDLATIRSEAAALATRREESRAREQRARSRAASSHEAERDAAREENFPTEDGGVRRRQSGREAETAAAIGTALHAALERWPEGAGREEGLVAARGVMAATLAGLLPPARFGDAEAEANAALAAFAETPLFERFRALESRVVARELPVLLPPGEEDPALGYVVGAVDLVYRDEDGALVVADYKSDVLESDAALDERVARYAAQGEVYVRAVREALALEEAPRFELWFLSRGEAVTVPPA